jgi:hypothetical protein
MMAHVKNVILFLINGNGFFLDKINGNASDGLDWSSTKMSAFVEWNIVRGGTGGGGHGPSTVDLFKYLYKYLYL